MKILLLERLIKTSPCPLVIVIMLLSVRSMVLMSSWGFIIWKLFIDSDCKDMKNPEACFFFLIDFCVLIVDTVLLIVSIWHSSPQAVGPGIYSNILFFAAQFSAFTFFKIQERVVRVIDNEILKLALIWMIISFGIFTALSWTVVIASWKETQLMKNQEKATNQQTQPDVILIP